MTPIEARQLVINDLRREANNGLWLDLSKKTEFVFCVRDACFPEEMGKLRGIVTALKSFGNVSIEPNDEEGVDASYIRIIITPRSGE